MSSGLLRNRTPAVVVIGASAGGVEALGEVLPALRPACGFPVLVVLHLPPARKSLVVELFGAKCASPVQEAQDKERALPGVIYFAPPDYHLLVEPGPHLALSVDPPVHFSRPSIDVLFESAADVLGARTLAVLLSGANEDGAAGLAAVARAGGLVFVQDPNTAGVPTMPLAGLHSTPTAAALAMGELAELFAALGGEVSS